MKRRNYIFLMAIGIVAMMLIPVTPCRAEWQYLGSYLPNDPPYDSGGDDYSHWEYNCSNSTSAGSGGVSASGSCNASTWVSIYVWEGGIEDMSKSVYTSCATYGYSYYADFNPPNRIYIDWSISASGSVDCSGRVEDRYCDGSTYAGSSSGGGVSGDEGYGSGYAWGNASTALELANAGVDWGGSAQKKSSSVSTYYGSYSASLSFSVNASDGYYDDNLTSFTAYASVGASSSSSGSASLTEGDAYADSDSEGACSGSASTSVSY
jgi:hypothetical protein